MNLNNQLFSKINGLIGRSRWLDAFGRAGAEWAIVAMLGWFVSETLIVYLPDYSLVFWLLVFLVGSWFVGFLICALVGLMVREPRPHLINPVSKLLFQPLSNWKSFPSDHAMSAWLIFFIAILLNLPAAWALIPLALWVSWGRVYAGVHYPLDMVGGLAVAGVVAWIGYYVLVLI